MKYDGPNLKLVAPVMTLARSGFQPAKSPDTTINDVVFTTDIESAIEQSFSQDFEPLIQLDGTGVRLMNLSGEDENNGWLWRDILNNMVASQIWTTEYHDWAAENQAVTDAIFDGCDTWRSISDRILSTAPGLDEDCVTEIGEDLAGMLLYTAYSRAFHGHARTYYDKLFEYICRGYWPCGFSGTWSDSGQHVLWYPGIHPNGLN